MQPLVKRINPSPDNTLINNERSTHYMKNECPSEKHYKAYPGIISKLFFVQNLKDRSDLGIKKNYTI